MEDTKVNNGLLAVILIASMFAGWQTVLLVAVLLLVFGKINDGTKKMMITIITFLAGVALFNLFWDLIVSGVGVLTNSLTGVIEIINSYLDEPINILKFQQYFLSPLTGLLSIADRIVDYAILAIKFTFIVSLLTSKKMSENFLFKKINEYVTKFTDYLEKFGQSAPVNNEINNMNQQNPFMGNQQNPQ